jgi:hypothetical protein
MDIRLDKGWHLNKEEGRGCNVPDCANPMTRALRAKGKGYWGYCIGALVCFMLYHYCILTFVGAS